MSMGRSALVLKEFSVNYDGPEYVHIVARKAGLVSWLLTLMGIDATTVFRVYGDRIEFQEGSLSGRLQTVMPMKSISITSTGYMKPVMLIVWAGFFLLLAIPTFGITLIFSIICFIFYFLNKNLVISAVSNSGWPALICFKRSVIEGVTIEYAQAQEVINVINQLLMQQVAR